MTPEPINYCVVILDDLALGKVELTTVTDQIMSCDSKDLHVLGTIVWERTYFINKNLILFLLTMQKHKIKLSILTNGRLKGSDFVQVLEAFDVTVKYIDFFFWRVYQEIIVKQTNPVNRLWNPHSKKFLFLTGKAAKPHNRVSLLWDMFKKNLLPQAIWSFYVPDNEKSQVLKLLVDHGVDLREAQEFIKKYQSNPDNVVFIDLSYGNLGYGGIPYDPDLYKQSKFRVVSETMFLMKHQMQINDPSGTVPWVTEKTWMTIVNCCPFIMAGDNGTLAYLENLGFRTFSKYLLDPDYDNIHSSYQKRINAILENTRHWLENDNFVEDIAQDVEYNYNHFIELGEKMKHELLKNLIELKLTPDVDLIDTSYNNIGTRL